MLSKHRKLQRWNEWNYSENGWYFVTICTHQREPHLGGIDNYQIVLSDIGQITHKCWLETINHFENVWLDEFMVMPNHIHGIIIINNVGNRHACSLRDDRNRQTLPVIIGSFKSAVSKLAGYPIWQKSFHDRIIRSENEYLAIKKYIQDNPKNWDKDTENR